MDLCEYIEERALKHLIRTLGCLLTMSLLGGCAPLQAITDYADTVTGNDIKDVRLRPAKMNDATLEAEMVRAYRDAGWKETVRGITITASEWTIKRDPVHGAITHRTIPADMIVQAQGKTTCRYFSVSYKQQYDGAEYGVTTYGGTGNTEAVDCEKAQSTDND